MEQEDYYDDSISVKLDVAPRCGRYLCKRPISELSDWLKKERRDPKVNKVYLRIGRDYVVSIDREWDIFCEELSRFAEVHIEEFVGHMKPKGERGLYFLYPLFYRCKENKVIFEGWSDLSDVELPANVEFQGVDHLLERPLPEMYTKRTFRRVKTLMLRAGGYALPSSLPFLVLSWFPALEWFGFWGTNEHHVQQLIPFLDVTRYLDELDNPTRKYDELFLRLSVLPHGKEVLDEFEFQEWDVKLYAHMEACRIVLFLAAHRHFGLRRDLLGLLMKMLV